jgi:hypothetical protein
VVSTAAEQEPTLQRLSNLQRVKEFFRPGLRKKCIAEEFALSQRIQSHIDDPIEPPSLPGAGLLKFKE